jgi:hypothetical protein
LETNKEMVALLAQQEQDLVEEVEHRLQLQVLLEMRQHQWVLAVAVAEEQQK